MIFTSDQLAQLQAIQIYQLNLKSIRGVVPQATKYDLADVIIDGLLTPDQLEILSTEVVPESIVTARRLERVLTQLQATLDALPTRIGHAIYDALPKKAPPR